jgi:hypothetical protein
MRIEEVKEKLDLVRKQIKLYPHNLALARKAHELKNQLYSLLYGSTL